MAQRCARGGEETGQIFWKADTGVWMLAVVRECGGIRKGENSRGYGSLSEVATGKLLKSDVVDYERFHIYHGHDN